MGAERSQPKKSSHDGAAYLPAPRDIVAALRSKLNDLAAQYRLAEFMALRPHLETLSAAFILQAVQRLGWNGSSVDRAALSERLGVVERHARFFARLLAILEEAGMVVRAWMVESVCAR